MSSYSVGNNVSAFRVSEPFGFINTKCSIQSSGATTVSGNDRLFVSAEFASWARRRGSCAPPLGARPPLSLLRSLSWGAVRRVDMRHSAGVAGVALTRWCGSAIVGVINMERGRVLVSSLVFRLSSNFGRTTDSDSVNPGSSPGRRAEKHTRSRVGAALFLSLALCPSG